MSTHPQHTDTIFIFIANFTLVISQRRTKRIWDTLFHRARTTKRTNRFGHTITLDKCDTQIVIEFFNLGLGGGTTGNHQLNTPPEHRTNLLLHASHDKTKTNFLQPFLIFQYERYNPPFFLRLDFFNNFFAEQFPHFRHRRNHMWPIFFEIRQNQFWIY